MAKRLMELCPRESTPRKDSLRRAVERHAASLGLSGNHRKRAEPNPAECTRKAPKEVSTGAWTPGEISALLATLGGGLINETIVERTHHSVKACLGYPAKEASSFHANVKAILESVDTTLVEATKAVNAGHLWMRAWDKFAWIQFL